MYLCCRPLWVEYTQDPATFAVDDEFLIGEMQNIESLMFFSDKFKPDNNLLEHENARNCCFSICHFQLPQKTRQS